MYECESQPTIKIACILGVIPKDKCLHSLCDATERDHQGGNDASTAITARNVELTYADGTRAVRGLDISTGEFFGFLGPNGAGKTTAIKTFVTLLHPTSGTVTVNGFDVVANLPRCPLVHRLHGPGDKHR